MTWPTIKVLVSPSVPPTDAVAPQGDARWVEIPDVLSVRIQGPKRDRFAGRFAPGRLTVVADSATRSLDPWLAGATLLPRSIIRVQLTALGVTTALWTGYVDAVETTDEDPSYGSATITATDASKLLARQGVSNTSFPEASTSTRLGHLLDATDWPVTMRDIPNGLSSLAPLTVADDAAVWPEIERTVDHEHGTFFFDGYGNARFRSRAWPYTSAAWAFDDTGSGLEFVDLGRRSDDDRLVNHARHSNTVGLPAVYESEDVSSLAAYGRVTESRADWTYVDPSELWDWPWAQVQIGRQLIRRIDSLTVDPTMQDALWPFIAGATPGERITVGYSPPGGGAPIAATCFIDGLTHDIRAVGASHGSWRTTVQLSDATSWPTFSVATYDSATYDSAVTYFY